MPSARSHIYAAVITKHAPDAQNLALPGYDDARERPATGVMLSEVLRVLHNRLEKPEDLEAVYLFQVKRGWERNLGGMLFAHCREDILLPQETRGLAKRLENSAVRDGMQNRLSSKLHAHAQELHDALDERGMKMIVVDGEQPLPPVRHIVSMRDYVAARTGEVYVKPGPLKQLAA